jgi:hypothetical protein
MMRTNYGHAGQARIPVADWNRANAGALSAILGRTGSDVAAAFAVEYTLPLNNSLGGPAAMTALDDTVNLRSAIEIAGTTSPGVRRPSWWQDLADRIDQSITFRRVLL